MDASNSKSDKEDVEKEHLGAGGTNRIKSSVLDCRNLEMYIRLPGRELKSTQGHSQDKEFEGQLQIDDIFSTRLFSLK